MRSGSGKVRLALLKSFRWLEHIKQVLKNWIIDDFTIFPQIKHAQITIWLIS